MRGWRGRIASAGLVAALAAGATACSTGLDALPAPPAISGPTYHLTVAFQDVETLALGAKVKLGGVVIGEVSSIGTHDFQASVGLNIATTFTLPLGTRFQVRFSTPLGEDFIAADPPATGTAVLADGAHVPVDATSAAPTIEDTFAALSLLLNGGGLDNLHTIVTELDTALHGRGNTARDTLQQLDKVVSHLDAHKADIDAALTGLANLGAKLNSGTGLIEQALAEFPQTLQVLAGDTSRIRLLLTKVAALGDTVRGLLARSQDAMLADFDALRPTLDALTATQSQLLPTMDSLIRFGQLFQKAAPGDYLNLMVTVQFLFDAAPQHPQKPAPAGADGDAITTLLSGGLR